MPARRRTIVLAAATVAVFVVAWLAGRQVGVSTSLTTRIYDVRELLIRPQNYDDPPSMGLVAATRPASARPATNSAPDDPTAELIRLIQSSIHPQSWNDPGRATTPVAGHIAVTHTPETHERIIALLSDLRTSRAITITLEASFFTVDPENFPRLPPRLRDALSASTAQPKPLSEDLDSILYDRVINLRVINLLSRPRITVFSGQRAYALMGNQRAYLAGISQSQRQDGTIVYNPSVETTSSGVLLDLHATASADRKHVTMTLRPQYSELLRIESAEQKTLDGKTHSIHRPVVVLRDLHTTVTIPDRQSVLLAAFDQTVSASTQPTTRPARQIFLLIKPTITVPPAAADSKVLPSGK